MINMLKYDELIKKSKEYLRQLVPDAKGLTFEEFGTSRPIDNPANAAIIVLSYDDPSAAKGITSLFSRKHKKIYLNPDTGELLAIKSHVGSL